MIFHKFIRLVHRDVDGIFYDPYDLGIPWVVYHINKQVSFHCSNVSKKLEGITDIRPFRDLNG